MPRGGLDDREAERVGDREEHRGVPAQLAVRARDGKYGQAKRDGA